MLFCRYELRPFSSSFMLWPVHKRLTHFACSQNLKNVSLKAIFFSSRRESTGIGTNMVLYWRTDWVATDSERPKSRSPDSREKTPTLSWEEKEYTVKSPINKVKINNEKKEFWVHTRPGRFLLTSINYI